MAEAAGLGREQALAEIGLAESELGLGQPEAAAQRLRQVFRRASAGNSGSGGGQDGEVLARAALGLARAMTARGLLADARRYVEMARRNACGAALEARVALIEGELLGLEGHGARAARRLQECVAFAEAARDGLLAADARGRLGGAERTARPA
jgi:hypothetical protein